MDNHRQSALEFIHEYYYSLPNNGYLNYGINSCESRYKEAVNCALINVRKLILVLEFISIEVDEPAVMDRINFFDKVEEELYKIKAEGNKMTLDELNKLINNGTKGNIKQ